MNGKKIQIQLTDKEFENLMEEARAHQLSVHLYAKGKILDNEFSRCYNFLIDEVNKLTEGQAFNIPLLFGISWKNVSKGVRLNLGKTFYKCVDDGTVPNVKIKGKDTANIMCYEKSAVTE